MTTKNIVTDYGAVADAQWSKQAFGLNTVGGVTTVTAPTATWVAGDVGKDISIGNAGPNGPQGGNPLSTTILSVAGDGKSITVGPGALTGLPVFGRATVIISWGTSCNNAFINFRNDFAGQTGVVLTIPAGTYLLVDGIVQVFLGIKELTVNATGATICGGQYQLGSGYQVLNPNVQAKTASVAKGATSITCLTPSQASLFVPGQYGLMTGLADQYFGYPSNHYLFEYVKIVSANTSTGVVTFTPPLKTTYLSTWPQYIVPTGSGDQLEFGGPAILYALSNGVLIHAGSIVGPSWDHTCVINGGTWVHDAQFAISGLSVTLNNCDFPSDYGPYPTMIQTCAFNNCTCLNGDMEYDKYVSNCTFTGCTWNQIGLQSADDVLTFDSTTANRFICSSRFTTIRNGSSIGRVQLGPIYAYASVYNVSDSVITQFCNEYDHLTGQYIDGGDGSNNGVNFDFTMSGGIMTIPSRFYSAGKVEFFAHAGGRCFWLDRTFGSMGLFTILAVTQDASNIYLHTDWTGAGGGFPPVPGKLSLLLHPAPSVTFRNVTGCQEVVDLSGAPEGAPLWSYTKRTHAGTEGIGENWPMFGVVKKLVVDVTRIYTGENLGSILATMHGGFCKTSNGAHTPFVPIINLRILGTRTLDTSGGYPAVWTGGKPGDTLPDLTEELWSSALHHWEQPDVSAEVPTTIRPIFTVEFITDQGFRGRSFTLTFT